ncbi:MAG: transglutaminase family protein [Pseudomonadota bacterium]
MQRVQAVVDRCRSRADSPRELAVALHDYVRDEVLFGFTPYFDAATPERTLRLGIGHCNPQATLMIALFRAAGFEARYRPATIGNEIMRGTADTPTRLSHLFTEVNLEGQWLRLDSYIVDPALRRSAIDRLRRDGRALGYGCHATATGKWDGRSNAFSQVATDSMIHELHDAVDDAKTFFASADYRHRVGPLRYNTLLMPTRLITPIAMRAANLRIERMRVRDLATA